MRIVVVDMLLPSPGLSYIFIYIYIYGDCVRWRKRKDAQGQKTSRHRRDYIT
jgi:hypothetical protein